MGQPRSSCVDQPERRQLVIKFARQLYGRISVQIAQSRFHIDTCDKTLPFASDSRRLLVLPALYNRSIDLSSSEARVVESVIH